MDTMEVGYDATARERESKRMGEQEQENERARK
jgi:hypothetical protein